MIEEGRRSNVTTKEVIKKETKKKKIVHENESNHERENENSEPRKMKIGK